ncbi:MAG: hypothetical protein ABI852_00845 [Gemmatimonadaceae bacterium]
MSNTSVFDRHQLMELIAHRLESPETSDTPSSVDSELLAALMDGTLSPSDAESLRGQLTKADAETLSAIADAMSIHAEFAQEEAKSITKFRWPLAIGALAAAAAVFFFVRTNGSNADLQPQQYASLTSASGAGLDRPTWSALRGATTETAEPTRSIRVGVVLANLALEAVHQDSVGDNLNALSSMISEISGSQPAVMSLQSMQTLSKLTVAQVTTISEHALPLVDNDAANLGNFLQTVRIAAAHNDVAFFEKTDAKALTNNTSIRIDDAVKTQLTELAVLIGAKNRDLSAIAALSDRVLAELTR